MSSSFPGNLGDILQQAQKMQEEMARIHSEVEKKEVEATAGGGMVTVRVNGACQVTSIVIDPAVVDSSDIPMLQDLVQAATNEGLRKAKELLKAELTKLTGGFPIPGFS